MGRCQQKLMNVRPQRDFSTPSEAFVIWGVWAGTDFVTGYIEMTGFREGALRIILIGVLLEVILLMRPQGILGEEKVVSKMYQEKRGPPEEAK